MKHIRKKLLTMLGLAFAILGILGSLLPIIPGYPFLIVAAILFAKSSRRFYHWLLYNRLFGRQIRTIVHARRVPLRTSLTLLAFLWLSILLSTFFVAREPWQRVAFVLTGLLLCLLYYLILRVVRKGIFKN